MRARNIKPGICKNEILGVADPIYTLLFQGLWMLADRDGRLEDRPVRIKGELFPYRDVDCDQMLTWLAAAGFILRYSVDGQKFIEIINFAKHQNPHRREAPSAFPGPDQSKAKARAKPGKGQVKAGPRTDLSTDKAGPIPEPARLIPDSLIPDSLIPDCGFSGTPAAQGLTKNSKHGKLHPLPDDFTLTPALTEYATKNLPGVDAPALFESFTDHAKAHAKKYADWHAAFQNWVRKAVPGTQSFAAGDYPKQGSGGVRWQ